MSDLRIGGERDVAATQRGRPFTFQFDGRPITAYPGETIGAALLAAGIVTLRTTRHRGRPRGLFCGIGVCFDCLVVVDGIPNQQACLAPARAGALVRTQLGVGQ